MHPLDKFEIQSLGFFFFFRISFAWIYLERSNSGCRGWDEEKYRALTALCAKGLWFISAISMLGGGIPSFFFFFLLMSSQWGNKYVKKEYYGMLTALLYFLLLSCPKIHWSWYKFTMPYFKKHNRKAFFL